MFVCNWLTTNVYVMLCVFCDGDGDGVGAVPVATVSTYAFAVESASGVRGHGVVFVRV